MSWSDKEELALIAAMNELIAIGCKSNIALYFPGTILSTIIFTVIIFSRNHINSIIKIPDIISLLTFNVTFNEA